MYPSTAVVFLISCSHMRRTRYVALVGSTWEGHCTCHRMSEFSAAGLFWPGTRKSRLCDDLCITCTSLLIHSSGVQMVGGARYSVNTECCHCMQVILLSPDAPEALQTVEMGCAYIIGGIVDRYTP